MHASGLNLLELAEREIVPMVDNSGGVWQLCDSVNCVINWLDHWQTLLTGFGAVGAAVVSVYYLRKQTADTTIRETTRRQHRFTAARARMPLQLSEIIQYADDAIILLRQYLDGIGEQQPPGDALQRLPRPTLPDQAILALETIIETTDDDAFVNLLAAMIAEMQVLDSRLRGLAREGRGLGANNLQAYLMNAAKVHAYAAGMFEFARRETENPPHVLDWNQAIVALNLSGLIDLRYPDLHAFMLRARDRAQAPDVAAQ